VLNGIAELASLESRSLNLDEVYYALDLFDEVLLEAKYYEGIQDYFGYSLEYGELFPEGPNIYAFVGNWSLNSIDVFGGGRHETGVRTTHGGTRADGKADGDINHQKRNNNKKQPPKSKQSIIDKKKKKKKLAKKLLKQRLSFVLKKSQ
jgi:hypothetical protein